ncbi:MAG: hypothetical protein WC952_13805 [Desulfobulbaceae bacterium]
MIHLLYLFSAMDFNPGIFVSGLGPFLKEVISGNLFYFNWSGLAVYCQCEYQPISNLFHFDVITSLAAEGTAMGGGLFLFGGSR